MIDEELINRKFKLIQQDLKQAKKLAALSAPKFLAEETYELIAERVLERIIGRLIDVNNHLIAALGEPPASDYYESFTALGRLGVFPPATAQNLAQYAGLRNRLAHEYNNLDRQKVFTRLKVVGNDVKLYFQGVKKFIKRS